MLVILSLATNIYYNNNKSSKGGSISTKINTCTNLLHTETTKQLREMEFTPLHAVMSRMLPSKPNLNADSLLAKYNILYSNKLIGTEKHIVLKLEPTDMYDKTYILDTVGCPRNTDNIVHTVQMV